MEKIKNLCIIQARTGSTRLPRKVLLKVKGKTLLEYVFDRVSLAKKIDKIVIATTDKKEDDEIERLCKKIGIDVFRGSENDVLKRYWECAKKYPKYENIVRITGDCPLIDPKIIDELVGLFEKGEFDYASNVLKETYPDGMDVEIFSRKSLEEASNKADKMSEREHVTLHIRNNPEFKKGSLEHEKNFSHIRLTVDREEDFEVVKFLIENTEIKASFMEYVELLEKSPEIMMKNSKVIRNEGLIKSLKEDKIV